jgi:hypothetical protein
VTFTVLYTPLDPGYVRTVPSNSYPHTGQATVADADLLSEGRTEDEGVIRESDEDIMFDVVEVVVDEDWADDGLIDGLVDGLVDVSVEVPVGFLNTGIEIPIGVLMGTTIRVLVEVSVVVSPDTVPEVPVDDPDVADVAGTVDEARVELATELEDWRELRATIHTWENIFILCKTYQFQEAKTTQQGSTPEWSSW